MSIWGRAQGGGGVAIKHANIIFDYTENGNSDLDITGGVSTLPLNKILHNDIPGLTVDPATGKVRITEKGLYRFTLPYYITLRGDAADGMAFATIQGSGAFTYQAGSGLTVRGSALNMYIHEENRSGYQGQIFVHALAFDDTMGDWVDFKLDLTLYSGSHYSTLSAYATQLTSEDPDTGTQRNALFVEKLS